MKLFKLFGIVFLLLISLVSVNAYTLDNDVRLYYPLYDNANDNSSYNLDGTNSGGTFNGSQVDLDGTNDRVYSNSDEPKNLNLWSFNIWFNFDTLASTQVLFSKNEAGTNNEISCYYYSTATDIRCDIDNGASYGIVTTSSSYSTTGSWDFLSITYDGTNLRLYLNGVLQDTTALSSATIIATGKEWELGSDRSSVFLNGKLKEFSIFNKTLDQTAVTELYNNGITSEPPAAPTPQIQLNITDICYEST